VTGVDTDLAYLKDRLQGRNMDALVRVEAELSRLREQRDALIRDRERWRLEWQAEVAAEEARCARLQQALAKIRDSGPRPRTIRSDLAYVILLQGIAREALAGPDTAACEHDWIWPANVVCAKCGISGGDTPADSQPEEPTT
jgi:hypothetical protein